MFLYTFYLNECFILITLSPSPGVLLCFSSLKHLHLFIPSMRRTNAPKTPVPAPSDCSDPAEEGILGLKPSKSPSPDPIQEREPWCAPPAASCSRRESDTELQAFLDLRDQTDHNTEVRDRQTDRLTTTQR